MLRTGAVLVTLVAAVALAAPGDWKRIGKPEFVNTVWLFGAAGALYTIENDGSLYAVSID